MVMLCSMVPINPETFFQIDRPFYYAIRDTELGAPLFEGRLACPSV